MKWKLRIEDPSGETRLLPLDSGAAGDQPLILGRTERSSLPLNDPTLPAEVGELVFTKSALWVRILTGGAPALLGDLPIREAFLPPGVPLRLGETVIRLESARGAPPLPRQPSGTKHWLTQSEAGKDTLWMTRKAARTPLAIYLAGETGVGKEVLAHLVHAWSERSSGPFIPIHCGALPLSLVESELFGHTKGAFTGAIGHRPGALMQAHNGTLFLDEIGDLPLDIQVKLLRFLENGEIRPLGADRAHRVDVRIVCATHHPLLELVESGRFRRDLYYRLASVTVEIPSLRTRPEDIELLARRFATELGRSLSVQAMYRLQAHSWPGNVRELRHAIERASGLAGELSKTLNEDSFRFLTAAEDDLPDSPQKDPEELEAILTLKEMEKIMLIKALRISKGNRLEAAKILGIARSTLFEMLKRHRISGPRKQR